MEDFLFPLLHDHQVVYQLDLIILESATHGFPDLREMLYFRMSLHEFTQLFLMSRRDEGAKTYLALHHVWREMTDDGTLGEIALSSYLVEIHTPTEQAITDFTGWNLRLPWFPVSIPTGTPTNSLSASSPAGTTRSLILLHQQELGLLPQIIRNQELSIRGILQQTVLQIHLQFKR